MLSQEITLCLGLQVHDIGQSERIMQSFPTMHLIPGLALETTSDIQILDPSQTQFQTELTSPHIPVF